MGFQSPSAEWSVKLKSSALNSKLPVRQPNNGAPRFLKDIISYTHPHKIKDINLMLSVLVQRGDNFCIIQRN